MGSMSFAPYSTLFNVLEKSGEITIDSLAYKVDRAEWEIQSYLETLQKEGLIIIDGDKIRLTTPRHKKHWILTLTSKYTLYIHQLSKRLTSLF